MKRRWIVLGVVGGLVVALVAAWFLFFRDTATPVTAADLDFTGTAGDAPGEPGIYVYDTTGFEEIDALGGAHHDYPAETYLVIEEGPCGPVVRWLALDERWERSEHCGPDLAVTTSTGYHEWFGIPDTGVSTCTSPIFPPAGETTWTMECSDGESTSTAHATVVGTETLDIGGQQVETLHIRIEETTSGSTIGNTTTNVWRLPGTPLVVRKQVDDATANASRIGDVHYVEQVTLQLRSLLPTG
ncbi:MAG TPA: hypothetical protein VGB41_07265 [Acidimicrobiia bacterium]